MKKNTVRAFALLLILMLFPLELSAQGFRGGGGGERSRSNAGSARPSAANLGDHRPAAASRPAPSRPTVSAPTASRPAMSKLPEANRPSGGLKPSTKPSTKPSQPSTKPNNRLPNQGGNTGNNLPNRPESRPSIPGLGVGAGNRPNVNRPNGPDAGRPHENLPGAGTRPHLPSNGGRPSVGEVGDFLGMDKPLRPAPRPGTDRPNIGNEISTGIGNRPNIGNGSDNNIGNKIGIGNGNGNTLINNRPVNIGQINIGNNTVINNRPTWANIDSGRVTSINNRWSNQISGMHNWQNVHPNRAAFWAGWGAGVHSNYRWHYHNPNCFRGNWWYSHPCHWGGWHYGYGFANRPWKYWWTVPTYAACVNWFTWTAPPTVWAQPVYYDYGQGGNVVYNADAVYINGDQVATSAEFAQSAAELATVPAPASEDDAQKAEWLALGTFTVSAGEQDVDPTRILQLAVSKEGIISGTLFNTATDTTQAIQGQVDKQTQRVAMRFGDSEDIIAETGLYNLTQVEAPVLVHFGPEKIENWLLVRLDDPAPDDAGSVPRPQ